MKNPIFEKLLDDQATRSGFLNSFSTLTKTLTDELFKENKRSSELVKGVNQKNVNTLLEQTRALLDQMEEVTVTVAFSPDEGTILAISKFIRQTLGATVMINLKTDTKILAGAIISKNGIEKDYSWRKKLNDSRAEIDKTIGVGGK